MPYRLSQVTCSVIMLLSFAGCVLKNLDLQTESKKDDEYSLFQSALVSFEEGRYRDAIEDFESFESTYPLSPQSTLAQKFALTSYFKAHDYTMTKAASDRFLLEHPRDIDADYVSYLSLEANFMSAMNYPLNIIPTDRSLRQVDNLKELYLQILDFCQRFKESPYKTSVVRKLPLIREMIVQHELNTVEYMFRKHQYHGFIKHAEYLKKHFPETSQAQKAHQIYQKFLKKMSTEKIIIIHS